MTASEEFKKALRAGKLSEAFLLAMSKAPELHITTWIASPQANSQVEKDTPQPEAGNYLRTHINLIEGKIENEIGEKLIGDRNPEIHQFHLQQVTQGHQTIQQNLESLQKMFHLMTAFQNQQQGNGSQANWVDVAADSYSPQKLEENGAIGSLAAAEVVSESETATKVEPQLPSFTPEEDDNLVNDLLSLADLDSDMEEDEADNEDWGEWLEDEQPHQ
ncbi:MAG: hypothetical protein Tsb0014_33860 [Pleurocapsa sp.]